MRRRRYRRRAFFWERRILVEKAFRLYQKNIIELLKCGGTLDNDEGIDGKTFFLTCMAIEINKIASNFGCSVILTSNGLVKAQKIWSQEIKRQVIRKEGTPDQFKHAGMLAYWLRRCQVVERVIQTSGFDTEKARKHQSEFRSAPTEISSFLLGYQLSAYLTFDIYKAENYSLEMFLRDTKPIDNYIYDIGTYMKYKNVSPHSLYLIYRVMFENRMLLSRKIGSMNHSTIR